MAGTAGCFSDEQFQEACNERQQPALAGADWQLLLEDSGVTIYRLLDQVAADSPAGGQQEPGYRVRTPYRPPCSAGVVRLLLSNFVLCRSSVLERLS